MDMNKLTQPFDEFVTSKFQLKNEYIIALVSLVVLLYISATAPKLPEKVAKLLNNVFVHILMFFLVLWVSLKHSPSVAAIVAILVAVLILAMNLYKKKMETMMSIGSTHMNSIAPYVISSCGQPGKPCPQPEKHGEHGEMKEEPVIVDGPISGVSDAEMESLCQHIKKDKNATEEIVTSAGFSELLNVEQNCQFAKHQFKYDVPDVKCPDPASVGASDRPFPSEAPASQW